MSDIRRRIFRVVSGVRGSNAADVLRHARIVTDPEKLAYLNARVEAERNLNVKGEAARSERPTSGSKRSIASHKKQE